VIVNEWDKKKLYGINAHIFQCFYFYSRNKGSVTPAINAVVNSNISILAIVFCLRKRKRRKRIRMKRNL
jgi:hypothetical protein